jgi:hypothetical protein
MSEKVRIILGVIAIVVLSMGIAEVGVLTLSGNAPIIMMVIAVVISGMSIALAGLYLLNKAVTD